MARRFRRTRRGVRAQLDDVEKALLARLFDDVAGLLDDGAAGDVASGGPGDDRPGDDGHVDPLARLVGIDLGGEPPSHPQDPAVARLLPDAHKGDDAASGEFRRLTEAGLRERKRAGLALAAATLRRDGPLLLDDAEAAAWVVALTDVRLVVAERLGLRDDDDATLLQHTVESLPPEDPRAWLAAVYELLTWLQETLVESLTPS